VTAPRRAAQLLATFDQLAEVAGRPVETVIVDQASRSLCVIVTGDDFEELGPYTAPPFAGQLAFGDAGVAELEDPSAVIVGFLEQLDPTSIEQAALNRQGWGSGSLAAEILGVLRELAGGQPRPA
jgi:hypothetical protein